MDVKISLDLDREAALALATVIRSADPQVYGVDAQAFWRAVDALSPLLPPRDR